MATGSSSTSFWPGLTTSGPKAKCRRWQSEPVLSAYRPLAASQPSLVYWDVSYGLSACAVQGAGVTDVTALGSGKGRPARATPAPAAKSVNTPSPASQRLP